MALPEKSESFPDLLHLFVVGPGDGETVLLRIPPEQMDHHRQLRVRRPARPAAESIVSHVRRQGRDSRADAPTSGPLPGFRRPDRSLWRRGPRVRSPERQQERRRSLPIDAIAALKQAAQGRLTRESGTNGRKTRTRRWDTFRGEPRTVGEATVTSLHPVRPVGPAQWGDDPNAISSAMLVEWGNMRLLLGADVPSTEWPGIGDAFPGLSEHAAMKVPHHGSREAIHEVFGDGTPGRFWVITPFGSRACRARTDFANNGEPEGLSRALSFVNEVRADFAPFRHDLRIRGSVPDDPRRDSRQNPSCPDSIRDERVYGDRRAARSANRRRVRPQWPRGQ